MRVLNLLAPAKLNLFLHVTGRRADGYHELQTLFQLLDYGDRVDLSLRRDGEIKRTAGAAAVSEGTDLAVKAARVLKSASGTGKGCDIGVVKRIPLGAGLGGGSSDAAAVLVGLNRIWELELSEDRLAELGLELGADVPVFVRGCSAWAEGVGERLYPVSAEGIWYLVVTPPCSVCTARVFGSPALTRNTPALTIDRFTLADSGGASPAVAWDDLWAHTHNDCEPVARAMYPQVEQALSWLSRFAEARMTGTGGSVFAPFPDRAEAGRVIAQLPDGLRAFVARGLSRIDRTTNR
ncbi:MAG TPA: 4-(cytidine 5'-diphospho)-2-C-methyl-D-erythritol kinase [Gammaproteobacteria bacterium]|nr:4-(cytidine 5'-diphospho)-2-C-methyl-D-erythritol kinase [Gammaproteobacteria bacterium]